MAYLAVFQMRVPTRMWLPVIIQYTAVPYISSSGGRRCTSARVERNGDRERMRARVTS